MTELELAEAAGVEIETARAWLDGRREPPVAIRQALRTIQKFDGLGLAEIALRFAPKERDAGPVSRSPSLPGLCPIEDAVRAMSEAEAGARGAIFTRREVVDFILNLIGYSPETRLYEYRFLEPSFGEGDFLLPAIQRLLEAWRRDKADVQSLRSSIRGIELHSASFEKTRIKVMSLLMGAGLSSDVAEDVTGEWLIKGDFLLAPLQYNFDFVAGNPPYVRQELIPDLLMIEYRARYETIYDRADLYVPFIERSLSLLEERGQCGLICADRWMKNRYGGPLRRFVSRQFRLKYYIDMSGTQAFHAEVDAYPAITVISRERNGVTRVARQPHIEADALKALAGSMRGERSDSENAVEELPNVTTGSEPWMLENSEKLRVVRKLEGAFPTIEEAGCKVGIGVATGADQAFVGPFEELDVEDSRKLPLVMTRDILSGEVHWRGLGVVNPFNDDGSLVDLENFPRLKSYFDVRRYQIDKRHVAKKNPKGWFRTIDRIFPAITHKEKLLIPDIKGGAHVVYEDGKLYPHHNLYFITSDDWDMRALQAVLISGIAALFVGVYCTKMRGGFLRFQAQYLRRIRLPKWDDVSPEVRLRLRSAALSRDVDRCADVVAELYGLSEEERLELN